MRLRNAVSVSLQSASRRSRPVVAALLWDVAMHEFDAISGVPKMFADFLGDHDRTVLSAGTTERNRQIALSLVDVVRQKVNEQVGDARDELAGLGKRADVLGEA